MDVAENKRPTSDDKRVHLPHVHGLIPDEGFTGIRTIGMCRESEGAWKGYLDE